MRKLRKVLDKQLADTTNDQVSRSHADAIRELQGLAVAQLRVISNVALVNGVATPIAHRLGRAPTMVIVSPARGAATAGAVIEPAGVAVDRTRFVILTATGFGATVNVDVTVF